jgi:molybdate transport repressor ModE-like protein
MAYSHAWSEIKEIEDAVDSPIIITSRGGKDGGSTCLTEFGEDILKQFDDEMKRLDNYINNRNRS